MTDEVSLAFAHPVERAKATAIPEWPLDRISLRDHVVEVEIGAFQLERGVRQRVRFNIVVEVASWTGPLDDDVDRILSYDRVTEAIAAALAVERLNLLETLAERVADLILSEPQARRVFVRIEKLDRGVGALGVEIVRARRSEPTPVQKPADGIQPRVVFLTNEQIADRGLALVIDRLAADRLPLVICVGVSDLPSPKAEVVLAQRRIDLLSIEQNAWVLAGREPRCIVVETRTEMDWAVKHGQISVWAPSKIVLDAVDGPTSGQLDALALTAWLAGQLNARELVLFSLELVEACVPVRHVDWAEMLA